MGADEEANEVEGSMEECCGSREKQMENPQKGRRRRLGHFVG